MVRHILALALVTCLSASWASAQTAGYERAELTVKIAAAEVHRFPSIGSPVIGKAPKGTVLEVRRNLGSWVEVPWPGGENGVAFVHVNTGTVSGQMGTALSQSAATPSSSPASSEINSDVQTDQPTSAGPSSVRAPEYVSLPRHLVGVGGRLSGSAPDFGATTRMWFANRLGVQVELSRSRLHSVGVQGHMNSMLFAPSVLYALPDGVAGSVWMRPYAGAGTSLYRSTLGSSSSAVNLVQTDWGFHAFGGSEATFAGAPQLTISADFGYRWSQPSFAGYEPGRVTLAVAAHWYVK
jgi:hypothetical protein